jgi:hypothetical protein
VVADKRFALGVTFRLFEPAGHGEHHADVIVRAAEPGYCKVVDLASEEPIAAGLVFGFDGRAWRIEHQLGGDGEGMWTAEPVAQ